MQISDAENKPWSIVGFADGEMTNVCDFAYNGIHIGEVNGDAMVFKDGTEIAPMLKFEYGKDDAVMLRRFTGGVPREHAKVEWKCGCLITTFRDGSVEDESRRIIQTNRSAKEMLEQIVDSGCGVVYFHNLKFDMSYLVSEIINNGELKAGKYVLALNNGWKVYIKEDEVRNRGFGAVYRVKIHYQMVRKDENGVKKAKTVELRDSAKIWRGSLDSLGNDFGIVKGGTTGGSQALRVGCDDIMIQYCIRDVEILATVMWVYFKLCYDYSDGIRPNGYMTAASTAYGLAQLWWMRDMRKRGFTDGKMLKRLANDRFPKLDCIDDEQMVLDDNGVPMRDDKGRLLTTMNRTSPFGWFRDAYKGATPLLDRTMRLRDRVLCIDVQSADINSAYPDILARYPLPVGEPIDGFNGRSVTEILNNGEDVPDKHTWMARVYIKAVVKKGHRATFIQKKGKGIGLDGEETKTIDVIDDVVSICEPEFEMICRDYDVEDCRFIEAYAFETMVGVFRRFVFHFYALKSKSKRNGNMGLCAFCKLIINSFYGKFGSNAFSQEHSYFCDANGILRTRLVSMSTDVSQDFYLPYAVFITAHVRNKISMACGAVGWDNVVYTDTDSMKIINLTDAEITERLDRLQNSIGKKYITVKVHEHILGAFKLEGRHDVIAFIRNKGYICMDKEHRITKNKHGIKEITMGGMNIFSGIDTLDDVLTKKGHQLHPYHAIGGTLLMAMETRFEDDGMVKSIRYNIDGVI